MKPTKFFGLIAATALLLFLASCHDPLHLPHHAPQPPQANVTVSIGGGSHMAARTLFPQEPVFSRFELRFEPREGQTPPESNPVIIEDGETDAVVSLELGEWEITATGFVVIDGGETAAASGSKTVTVEEGDNNFSIGIHGTMEEGAGVLAYEIGFPDGTDTASLCIYTLDGYFADPQHDPLKETDLIGNGNSGSFTLNAGFYLLYIKLEKGEMRLVKTEAIHIYDAMITDAAGEDYTFDDDSFFDTTPPPSASPTSP